MSDPLKAIRIASWVALGAAVLASLLLIREVGVLAGMCLVVGAMIGAGSASSVPGRPKSLYAMFGAVMGYTFWLAISLLRRGDVLSLVLAAMLVVGVSWMLRKPSWASAIFTWASLALALIAVYFGYRNRYNIPDADPNEVAHSSLTAVVFLGIGLVESAIGLAEAMLGKKSRKTKKAAARAIRTPSEPPMI